MNRVVECIKNCFSRLKSFFKANFIRFKKWFRRNHEHVPKLVYKVVTFIIILFIAFSIGTCNGYNYFKNFDTAYASEVTNNGSGVLPPKENGVQYQFHSIINWGSLLSARNESVVDGSCENLVLTTLSNYSDSSALIGNMFDIYTASRGASDISGTTRLLLETRRFKQTARYTTQDRGIVTQYKVADVSNWNIAFYTNVDRTTLGCVNTEVFEAYAEFYYSLDCSSLSTITRIDRTLYKSSRYTNSVVNSYKFYTNKYHEDYPGNVGDYALVGALEIWSGSTGDITLTGINVGTNSSSYEPLFSVNMYNLLNNSYDLGFSAGKEEGISQTTQYYEEVVLPSIQNGSYDEGKLAGIELGKEEMRNYYEKQVIPTLSKQNFDKGYNEGLKDGAKNPTLLVFDAITSGVNRLLRINILPNFTLLHFSLIVFSFVMFFMLLHRLQK